MRTGILAAIVVSGCLITLSAQPNPTADHEPATAVALSPELLELLRAEMRQLTTGVQQIALSLATADWDAIRKTSAKINASYIMKQTLTPDQAVELKRVLPDKFKRLDARFHQRAERLAAAAEARDPELAAFHYYRLVESCAGCHSAFASGRFPGFARPVPAGHHH